MSYKIASSLKIRRSCLFLLVSAFASSSLSGQTPFPLEPGFQIDSVMVTQPNPNRMAFDAVRGRLFYCIPGGNVYEVFQPTGAPAYDSLVYTIADHGIAAPQGMHFRDSVLYLSGNTNANPGYVTARISKGTLQPNGSRIWATVAQTQPHPASTHPFTSVISDPQGQFLYWASGARTMAGEVFSDNGLHPGRREGPYNSRLYKIPINSLGLTLPADSNALDASGYVYCMGLRNAYDMDFDAAGELFAIDNSGERDDPEELNWLRPGYHYGFPWKMGDHWNPLMNPNYDVHEDPLVNPLCGGYIDGIFAADPNFPAPPNTVLIDPIQNLGPSAVFYRDSITGQVHNAFDEGKVLRSFTAHRSPLGLVIDRDSLLDGAYQGAAYLLSYMPGGDSSGMSPLAPWGTPGPFVDPCQDMLKVDLNWDSGVGEYVMHSRRIIGGFYLPVDAAQVGNAIYVIEQRQGGRSNLWKVTFPLDQSQTPSIAIQYSLTVSPNPTYGVAQILVQAPHADEVHLQLRDLKGQSVGSAKEWKLLPGENRLDWDLSHLPAGMYFLQLRGQRGSGNKAIVKR